MPNDLAGGVKPETLWRFRKTSRDWSCELRRRLSGFEALISVDGRPVIVQSFQSRQQAVAWADDEQHEIKRGL
jgi:hypothetical protein